MALTATAQYFRTGCLLIGSHSSLVTSLGEAPAAQSSFQWIGRKTRPGEMSGKLRLPSLWRYTVTHRKFEKRWMSPFLRPHLFSVLGIRPTCPKTRRRLLLKQAELSTDNGE